jgi:hypothetical protein
VPVQRMASLIEEAELSLLGSFGKRSTFRRHYGAGHRLRFSKLDLQFLENTCHLSTTNSLSTVLISDLIDCPVSVAKVRVTTANGLKPSGELNVDIISRVALLCPRSNFET